MRSCPTRDEPLRTSEWEASSPVPIEHIFLRRSYADHETQSKDKAAQDNEAQGETIFNVTR